MGSSGSGNFTDYSRNSPSNKNQGGGSSENDCTKAYSISLEEVNRSEYLTNNGFLPPIGEPLIIRLNTRLVAVSTTTDEEIGYLPTSYNFLVNCLNSGITYSGNVTSAISGPISSIKIDIAQ